MMTASVLAAGLLGAWSRRQHRRGHGALIELGVAAVLFPLAWALPRRPREEQVAGAEAREPILASTLADGR